MQPIANNPATLDTAATLAAIAQDIYDHATDADTLENVLRASHGLLGLRYSAADPVTAAAFAMLEDWRNADD